MLIRRSEQVMPDWLTKILYNKGALEQGDVASVEVLTQASNRGIVSNIGTLKVIYSENASGLLPTQLFLKMSKPDLHQEFLGLGRKEVSFYNAMADTSDEFPIPRCYDAQYDAETGHSHILMDDLSETHFQRPPPIPPSNRHCEMIVESLARLHAMWWDSPRLGDEIGEPFDEKISLETRRRLENTLPDFIDYLGDALLPVQRRAYEQIMESTLLDRREKRYKEMSGITLVHGDTHTGNFMLPSDIGHGKVILIDWHLCRINVAASDLAFLIAIHWSSQRRAVLEESLLKHYYDQLVTHGVNDYTWDDLWRDYRESVAITTLIPIGQFRRKMPTGIIWFGLQDSMAAFQDLGCGELL